jgi:hypothetical protein
MMVSAQGEPLLADFGVVTLVRPNAGDVTDPAELAHVAPELLDGNPASAGSDLYSLASALFTLFAGVPAYVRPGEQSIIPVIKRIASDPLPDLAAKNVPAPVIDAISKGMAKDPADRHQTAQDLGRSLQQAQVALGLPMTEMTMLGSPTARAAPARRTTAPAGAAPPPTTQAPTVAAAAGPPGGAAPANRTPLVIAAIAVVVVLLAIAFFATRDSGSKTAVSPTTTTTRPKTTTTTETTITTLPSADDGTELLTNDGGQLEVNVPTSWTDHRTTTNNGTPELQASTDIAAFQGTSFLDPGVDFAVFPASTVDPSDLDAALDRLVAIDRQGSTLDTLCTRGTREDFTPNGAGLSTARFERLTSCNGGGDVIIIAATNADLTFALLMEVHFGSPPDQAGVDAATGSFNVVRFP